MVTPDPPRSRLRNVIGDIPAASATCFAGNRRRSRAKRKRSLNSLSNAAVDGSRGAVFLAIAQLLLAFVVDESQKT